MPECVCCVQFPRIKIGGGGVDFSWTIIEGVGVVFHWLELCLFGGELGTHARLIFLVLLLAAPASRTALITHKPTHIYKRLTLSMAMSFRILSVCVCVCVWMYVGEV